MRTGFETARPVQFRLYRKRPVEVMVSPPITVDTIHAVASWCGGVEAPIAPLNEVALVISTLEGPLAANWGDRVIRGVKGEFYAIKPEIFNETYEEVG